MKKLSWTTSKKIVDELLPQEVNPRKITEKQMSDLKKSLKKFNLVEVPAIDTRENHEGNYSNKEVSIFCTGH